MSRVALTSRLALISGAALALPTLFACLDHPLKPVEYDKAQEEQDNIALTVNKDVDILFVIDNSGSMGEEQQTLSSNFANFITVLEQPGVEANYRIGITTTDNGNPWCSGTTPEGGALRLIPCTQRLDEFVFTGTDPVTDRKTACTDFCTLDSIPISPTTTEVDPTPKSRPWIENIEKTTNLPAGITPTQAFQCFGPQGINGCGFEQHMESMYKALRRAEDAKENQYGFLRANAILAIVFVTDEVDCSHRNEHASIFAMNSNKAFWSDPMAAYPTSAVCWNAGVKCIGGPGTYDTCEPQNWDPNRAETNDGGAVLHPVSRYTDLVRNFEATKQANNPNQEVIVAAIAGVPNGYAEGMAEISYADSANPMFQNDFGIGPGCSSSNGTAVPPVRLRAFAEEFETGGNRNLYSVCADNYGPALSAIARAIAEQVRPACMPVCVQDTDLSTPWLDPTCDLTERVPGPNGVQSNPVPECTPTCGGTPCARKDADGWQMPAGATACYRMLIDDGSPGTPSAIDDMSDECKAEGWNLEFAIERSAPAPGGTAVEANCSVSATKSIDCPLLP